MTNVSLPSHARRKSRNINPATRVVVLLVVVSCILVTELYLMTPRSSYTRDANLALPPKIDSTNDDDAGLPLWIQNYFVWHKDMRAKYPGKELFTDPSAPNVIVRVCLGLCGGLNDRLGQLPWDLYLANQTNRVLLIKWERPRALENFLIPNEIDWSIPADVDSRQSVSIHRERRKDPKRPWHFFQDEELAINLRELECSTTSQSLFLGKPIVFILVMELATFIFHHS